MRGKSRSSFQWVLQQDWQKEGGQINQGRVGGSGKSLHWRNHRIEQRERRLKTGRKRRKKGDDSENRENVPEHNRPLTLPAALFAPPPHPTLSLPFHQKSPRKQINIWWGARRRQDGRREGPRVLENPPPAREGLTTSPKTSDTIHQEVKRVISRRQPISTPITEFTRLNIHCSWQLRRIIEVHWQQRKLLSKWLPPDSSVWLF